MGAFEGLQRLRWRGWVGRSPAGLLMGCGPVEGLQDLLEASSGPYLLPFPHALRELPVREKYREQICSWKPAALRLGCRASWLG